MSHDFKTLSLSFTAGVAIAVLFPPPHPILASAAVVYSSLAATLYYSKRVHASSIIPYIVLFLLGINSYLCSGFGACLGSVSQNHIVKTALGSFQEAISRLNLSGEQTEALATALLTGDRKLLSAQTISDFRTAGASHILALSGLHLGLTAGFYGQQSGRLSYQKHHSDSIVPFLQHDDRSLPFRSQGIPFHHLPRNCQTFSGKGEPASQLLFLRPYDSAHVHSGVYHFPRLSAFVPRHAGHLCHIPTDKWMAAGREEFRDCRQDMEMRRT